MNLLNLLDKNSRIQISMVHFLLDYNAKTSTTTMIEELALTRFLFETNIEEVGSTLEQLNIGLSLTYDKIHNSITLQKDNHTSLDKFYYYYLNRSVDYQILIYLYQHPSYSIVDLSHSVSLSEAAIYRHLKKIKQGN
ncbi:helix-turn-helix domain-containing protein [Enterococcus thailandicus]|uniref:helix-turn-helix domain-containing protein n=1 Tax=Enterococcus thailandicus TaxID=417368 RepID=UPI0022DF3E5D|nr:helix-turn-helix domain-containing protein [Enterococcus thailandicus]